MSDDRELPKVPAEPAGDSGTPPGAPADDAIARRVLLGLGFDGEEGHRRVTKSDDFLLLGGSAATHGRMTEKVLAFHDALARFGRKLEDLSAEEYYEIVRQVDREPWSWFYGNKPYPFPFGGASG